jgi:hypothetical protein
VGGSAAEIPDTATRWHISLELPSNRGQDIRLPMGIQGITSASSSRGSAPFILPIRTGDWSTHRSKHSDDRFPGRVCGVGAFAVKPRTNANYSPSTSMPSASIPSLTSRQELWGDEVSNKFTRLGRGFNSFRCSRGMTETTRGFEEFACAEGREPTYCANTAIINRHPFRRVMFWKCS